jgi:uncharacterized protein with HEPN domain
MSPESRKLLEDMSDAARDIASFAGRRTLPEYLADKQLRWSVERGFEIIGEALTQLSKVDRATGERITDHRKITSFRNVLIHAYGRIDDTKTWDIVQTKLPVLRLELAQLLSE